MTIDRFGGGILFSSAPSRVGGDPRRENEEARPTCCRSIWRKQSRLTIERWTRSCEESLKKMFSHGEDVSLANPLGPPVRGWAQVEETLERAVANLTEGGPIRFERISEYATRDLAYIVEFERWRGKAKGSPGVVSMALRVTTIFRRESDGWRIIHRHADPITTARPIESIFEKGAVEAG